MQTTVLYNQNLFDIAIQQNGNALTIFELALLNGLSPTDDITPEQKIEVAKSSLMAPEIVDYFINRKKIIATGSINSLNIRRKGIGSMIVGNDFIVG